MGCSSSVPVILNAATASATAVALANATEEKNPSVKPVLPSGEIKESQKHTVRKTWKYLANDMRVNGTKIFLRIFELNPHVKQLFPFRDLPGADLVKDQAFKDHALRFMQAVGAAVDNLDHLDTTLGPLLLELGKQHINFNGFKPGYFEAFLDGISSVWKEELMDKCTAEVEEAWNTVFIYIMKCLQCGYHAASKGACPGKGTFDDIDKEIQMMQKRKTLA